MKIEIPNQCKAQGKHKKNYMKSAFFIMKLWQTGNIGVYYNITKIEGQSADGYRTKYEAEAAMLKMKRNGNWELSEGNYDFAIMKLYWR